MDTPHKVNDKVWVVVPAAGSGRRMGTDLPKQYLPLLGKTIIEHTLDKLVMLDAVEGIMVALSPDDPYFATLPIAAHPKIFTTEGGDERSASVLSALVSLEEKASLPQKNQLSDWVLVHDAARCCIRLSAIQSLLTALANNEIGGILGVPVSDTLKKVGRTQTIVDTVDRTSIWQAQTPQMFRYDILIESLRVALRKGLVITDEASAVEMAGYSPAIVMGHYDNIKITHPEDLDLAAAILREQDSSTMTINYDNAGL